MTTTLPCFEPDGEDENDDVGDAGDGVVDVSHLGKGDEYYRVGRIIVWTFIHEWIDETPSSRALPMKVDYNRSISHFRSLCARLRLCVRHLLCFVLWRHFDLTGDNDCDDDDNDNHHDNLIGCAEWWNFQSGANEKE